MRSYLLLLSFMLIFLFKVQSLDSNLNNQDKNQSDINKLKELFLQELEFEASIQEEENNSEYFKQITSLYDDLENKEDLLNDEIKNKQKNEIKNKRKERRENSKKYRNEIKKIKKEGKELRKSLKKEYKDKIAEIEKKYDEARNNLNEKSKSYSDLKRNFKREKYELNAEYREKLKIITEEKENLKQQRKKMRLEYSLKRKELSGDLKNIRKSFNVEKEKRENELINEVESIDAELREKYRIDKRYYTEEAIKKDILDKIGKLRGIINDLSEDSITFVTNGTRLSTTQPESKYFFSDQSTPNSFGYADEIADLLNSKAGVFLSWSGGNNDQSRVDAAMDFCQRIKNYLEIISASYDIPETSIPINLAGHSHGGNIMIMVANKLKEEGYNVQFLFTFGTPCREYQLKYTIPHVQLYSYKDNYQKIGGWDFDFLWFDLNYNGKSEHKFKNAININLIFFLDDELLDFYNKEYIKVHTNANYYHQITRYVGTIKKVIDGDLFYKGSIITTSVVCPNVVII